MKFFRSPLSILGFMVTIASLLMTAAMWFWNFHPTNDFYFSLAGGIVLMPADYYFIRQNPSLSLWKKTILQYLITCLVLIRFRYQ
jgi:glucose-6-phosphate-specific signal transduction histidine kinase